MPSSGSISGATNAGLWSAPLSPSLLAVPNSDDASLTCAHLADLFFDRLIVEAAVGGDVGGARGEGRQRREDERDLTIMIVRAILKRKKA